MCANRVDLCMAEFMHEYFVVGLRARCRHKESSRSLSHLLMSFFVILLVAFDKLVYNCFHKI